MKSSPSCCSRLIDRFPLPLFKALSEPNRLIILTRLSEAAKEMTVSELAPCCKVDFSVVSRHLRTLKEAGLLEAEKRGKEVYYRVRIQPLITLLRELADALEACCPGGLCPPRRENDGV